MKKLTLVVLAAGIGKRYGGLKQLEKIGPNGERLIEYSLSDASKAGFSQAVFIIRQEIQPYFDDLKPEWERRFAIEISYAYQRIDHLPKGFSVPVGREKPWGTAHALICAQELTKTPFGVVNADDYYGETSYRVMADFLKRLEITDQTHAMIGFPLKNTLSPHGTVSRGICRVDENGMLQEVVEYTKLHQKEEKIYDADRLLPEAGPDTPVSMNFWGFTPAVFQCFNDRFEFFLRSLEDPSKGEYYIPIAVDSGIKEGKFTLAVLKTDSRWAGITYKEDIHWVKDILPSL